MKKASSGAFGGVLAAMVFTWGAQGAPAPRPGVNLPPPPVQQTPQSTDSRSLAQARELVLMALSLPEENRLQALREQAQQASLRSSSFRALEQLSFEDSQSLQVRWRSLTALAQVYPEQAEPVLNRAAASSDWFMRNAALVAMTSLRSEYALAWAQKLSRDPALVVRTAAFQLIAHIGAPQTESLLWEQLYAPENFHNGQSLFVRRHIVKALSAIARPGQEARYIRVLEDADARLHPFAIQALEKISGRTLTAQGATVSQVKEEWLSWWGSQNLQL